MHQIPSPHPNSTPTRPSMADVWAEFPASPGMLVDSVREQLRAHAPLVPVHVPNADDQHSMRALPYRDGVEWLLLKHVVQAAFIASVVLFAASGGQAPLMALGYVGTGLLLMVTIALADRLRFADRDPAMEIVEIVAPMRAPQPVGQSIPTSSLAPIVEQMQVVMPEAVRVT